MGDRKDFNVTDAEKSENSPTLNLSLVSMRTSLMLTK